MTLMTLLVLGGARAGKSRYAETRILAAAGEPDPVVDAEFFWHLRNYGLSEDVEAEPGLLASIESGATLEFAD